MTENLSILCIKYRLFFSECVRFRSNFIDFVFLLFFFPLVRFILFGDVFPYVSNESERERVRANEKKSNERFSFMTCDFCLVFADKLNVKERALALTRSRESERIISWRDTLVS